MAQSPVPNYQSSLALTEYFPLAGVFPSQGGGSTDFFLGEIGTFAGTFAPAGSLASGQLLPISQNTAIFSLLGTFYGGNGTTNFALPNLQGTTMVGTGQGPGLSPVTTGQQVGSPSTTLTFAQTPPNIGGQSQPVSNYQPSLGITYEIALNGVFPSQGGGGGALDTLGMIMAFAGNFNAGGWVACNGQLLSIAQNTALFSVLGTQFGGNGTTTFALPDLRGRDIVGASGTDPVGAMVGQANLTLTNGQTPDGLGDPVTSIDNRQPGLALEYLIATAGIFPTQGGGQDPTTPTLGQIVAFAGNFAPGGWALCNGQLLSIAQNTALFSVIGTTYGGNGTTTFALPDLRDKTVIGTGSNGGSNFVPGQVTGANSTTITNNQLPDTPPTITSNGGGAAASIAEVTSQTLVTTLTATDPDVGQTVTFSITGGEDQSLFQIVNGNQLSFVTAPDLNNLPAQGITPGYQVDVRAADGFGGFATQDITVNVVVPGLLADTTNADCLLLQNGSQLAYWQLQDTSIVSGGTFGPPLGAGSSVAGTGDFNADGNADLLLQTGQTLAESLLNGPSVLPASGNTDSALQAGWSVAGTGDFEGDGKTDILLQNGQQLAEWQMNGTSMIGGGTIGSLANGWAVEGIGDFNKDGRDDLLLQNGQQLVEWQMNGNSVVGGGNIGTLLSGWLIAGVADFNHDGNADILLKNGQQLALWETNGTSYIGGGNLPTLGAGWSMTTTAHAI
jgi:microcystin-dependent protein